MRVSWELEGRTPPWHCSPWTLSPRTAQKAGIRAPFYIRESPGGEVSIALQFIVKGPIPERWGCPIPEPPSIAGSTARPARNRWSGEGQRGNVQFIRKTISDLINAQR